MFNRYYILDKSGKSLAFEFTTSLDRYAQSKDTWLALGKKTFTVYTRVQVERVYKSNPIFEAKNTTFFR